MIIQTPVRCFNQSTPSKDFYLSASKIPCLPIIIPYLPEQTPRLPCLPVIIPYLPEQTPCLPVNTLYQNKINNKYLISKYHHCWNSHTTLSAQTSKTLFARPSNLSASKYLICQDVQAREVDLHHNQQDEVVLLPHPHTHNKNCMVVKVTQVAWKLWHCTNLTLSLHKNDLYTKIKALLSQSGQLCRPSSSQFGCYCTVQLCRPAFSVWLLLYCATL